MNWQPIETAPSGKRMLVSVPVKNGLVVIAQKDYFGIHLDDDLRPLKWNPTRWMPLPEAPKP